MEKAIALVGLFLACFNLGLMFFISTAFLWGTLLGIGLAAFGCAFAD